jgi:hypothetical protein
MFQNPAGFHKLFLINAVYTANNNRGFFKTSVLKERLKINLKTAVFIAVCRALCVKSPIIEDGQSISRKAGKERSGCLPQISV